MTSEPDDTSSDDATDSEGDDAAMSNLNTTSRIKVGIQTPGGLPDWLIDASIEDLTSPVMKMEAPSSRGYRLT